VREESPNKDIDKALKDLLKSVTSGADVIPDEVTAKVRVIQAAIAWEKVKHHVRDEEAYNPDAI
jgi:hypothetical protein